MTFTSMQLYKKTSLQSLKSHYILCLRLLLQIIELNFVKVFYRGHKL